ncbi:ABC transporter ATP-binding protein [Microcella daejeonensis]|uniref:ABC transporter ATP-binding protein n=1 Tax=Microcella daejeonensis TaxID=2994971 RepID=A0A9E8SAN1_9MICO|nr:ABC transporter ATP-binding protein [Microcella daejeonensis]WAB80812.1 ABC transporter ATP-binding protein [Microcella daejeonensis]
MTRASTSPWPRLLVGGRRAVFGALVVVGLVSSALAVVAAIGVGQALAAGGPPGVAMTAGLLLAFGGIAAARYAERVLGERLGQSFVMDLRRGLVRSMLRPDRRGSLGVLVTRTSNDLAAVRMWIAQGIAPLVTATPLVVGATVFLLVLDARLGGVVAGLLALTGCAVVVIAGAILARARAVRTLRGRLAALVADSARAAPSVAAGGGIEREVARVGRAGELVMSASIHRASAVGAMRALVLAAASAATISVVVVGTGVGLELATIGSALTLTGLLATPLADLGRSVEYRQNFRAARRMIEPALAEEAAAIEGSAPTADGADGADTADDGPVVEVAVGGRTVRWPPRTRVRLDPHEDGALLDVLVDAASGAGRRDAVRIGGDPIAAMSERRRRRLVGAGRSGWLIERGPLARAVTYRRPRLPAESAEAMLRRLGLDPDGLPDGIRTRLREGGAPLTAAQRSIVLAARAMLDEPPLLILDGMLEVLPDDAAGALLDTLRAYPGVVVLGTRRSEAELRW